MAEVKTLYRYDEEWFEGGGLEIRLHEFDVTRTTPCGVWIEPWCKKRFVNLTLVKKRAYPTAEDALVGFIRRKQRQVKILTSHLEGAKRALQAARDGNVDTYLSRVELVLP